MKLREVIEKTSLKAAAREAGLELRMVGGRVELTPTDPDDPRYCTDFILPTMRMVDACRADDFDFFRPFIDAGRLTEERMHRAAERYHLGKTRSGKPLFWMINERQEPLDAHIASGGWISTALKARQPLLHAWCPVHCLFGQHLLLQEPDKEVCIVESERSAVVLSEVMPECIWLATMYPMNLNVTSFEPLQGRCVMLYPRTDPVGDHYLAWLELADQARRIYDISVSVNDLLEDKATPEQKEQCIDLVDFLF